MSTTLANGLVGLLLFDWTPWLAITARQVKLIALLSVGFILLAVSLLVVLRLLRRLRQQDEGLGEPVEAPAGGAPFEESPSTRVVDAGIANLLEQAAPVDGDERSEDELFASVVRITVELGGVSIPALQRRLHLDFDRATGFVERMAEEGMLSEPGPGGKRRVTPQAQKFVDEMGAA